MDSETKKKVSDLISMVEGLSGEIDSKAEIRKLRQEIEQIREEMGHLKKKVIDLEREYARKKEKLDIMRKELASLFDH